MPRYKVQCISRCCRMWNSGYLVTFATINSVSHCCQLKVYDPIRAVSSKKRNYDTGVANRIYLPFAHNTIFPLKLRHTPATISTDCGVTMPNHASPTETMEQRSHITQQKCDPCSRVVRNRIRRPPASTNNFRVGALKNAV